jgi:mono/diheme cytochrome c family protein
MSNGVRAILVATVAFGVIQLVPVDRSEPEDAGPLVIEDVQVAEIFDRACADCHTNNTRWPWYGYIAPASWFLADHVNEGREHLNLSRWSDQSTRRQTSKLREIGEEVAEESMPMPSYLIAHPEARLTAEERQVLIAWAEGMEQQMGGRRSRGGSDADAEVSGDQPEAALQPAGSARVVRSASTHAWLRSVAAAVPMAALAPHLRGERAEVSFSNDIAPIFAATCNECHGAEVDGEIVTEAQLDLTSYEAVMAGSEFGEVIVPGDPDESYLLESVVTGDMPEDGDPLSEDQIDLIRRWIIEGAKNN